MPIELTTTRFASGLHFCEGPRIHEGALWLSDMHAQKVLKFDAQGNAETVVSVPKDPSGLGWLPDGDLLVVSMRDRKLMRWNGTALTEHADLSDLAPFHCNDMVVDAQGRAYVGNFGFDLAAGAEITSTRLLRVDPDGSVSVAAEDVLFPNGCVITDDGSTLILAETFGRRLTAFDIDAEGGLSNRRSWAEMPKGSVPDGICLDAGGGVWVASPTTNDCFRMIEGGEITHRVAVDRSAIACILNGTTLYVLTSQDTDPKFCRENATACVEAAEAPYPAAGLP